MSFDLRARRTTYGYAVPDTRYRKGYHRGIDKGADGGEVAQWLSSGIVTQITRNDSIGTWVETTNELGTDSKFIGYGHTRAPAGLSVGDRVTAGADGPIVQDEGDDHGIDWDGSHVHVWTGDVSGDMGVSLGDDLDPSAIFAATPSGATLGDTDMKLLYNIETGQLALVGGPAGALLLGKRDTFKNEAIVAKVWGAALDCTDTEYNVNVQYAAGPKVGSGMFPTADDIAAKVKVPEITMTATTLASLATKVSAAVIAKLPKKLTGTLS